LKRLALPTTLQIWQRWRAISCSQSWQLWEVKILIVSLAKGFFLAIQKCTSGEIPVNKNENTRRKAKTNHPDPK